MQVQKTGHNARVWWALAALAILLALLGLFYLYSTGALNQAIPKGIRPPAASSKPDTGAKFSMTVSPARIVIPQGAAHQEVTYVVSDSGAEDLAVTVVTGEISQRPDGGVVFAPAARGSAAAWVTPSPRTFSLKPGESQSVLVAVDIPTNPDAGDHQVGLTFLVPIQGSAGNVNINRGIGTQMLIAVPGPVVHDVSFGGLTGPWFADGGPIPLTLTVTNRGTVHDDYYDPTGVQGSASGGRVAFNDFSVLRETTRTVAGTWGNPPLLCWCTVRAYGDNGNGGTVIASTRVFVFPFRILVGLLVASVGLYLARTELRNRGQVRAATARAELEAKLEEARRAGFEEAARVQPKPRARRPKPPKTGD